MEAGETANKIILPQGADRQEESTLCTPQQINVGEVISKKFRKRLPRVVIRLLERLICQDEINYVLREYGQYEGMEFVEKLMYYFGIKLEILGEERLPQNPRALFVCNHPLGGLDGICLSHLIGQHYHSDIRYIVNDMLLFLHPFRNIFVPVNTLHGQSRDSVKRVGDALSSDYPVISFPAGICSRLIDGKIQDLPWKNSFVKQALKSKRDIVPLFFYGYNSRSFYKIEQLRKKVGIKFNIGTALLPKEMFAAKGSCFTVAVGEPLQYQNLIDSKLSVNDISALVRHKVYLLGEEFHLKTR